MLKNTVLQQKNERDQMLSRSYMIREKLSAFKKSLKSGLVKVITGLRRAGKSVFAFLLLKGQEFAYLNFDDESLLLFGALDVQRANFSMWKMPQKLLS